MKFYLIELLVLIASVIALINAAPAAKAPKITQAPKITKTPKVVKTPQSNNATCFQKQNAIDAENLQKKFDTFTTKTPCNVGDQACINNQFAQCTATNTWVLEQCNGGLTCCALPLRNKPGTSIACDTKQDQTARINEGKAACP
ncbi:15645_t:CDS:2 [Cetraspora pellucida]|uniref:15645_t:CDS:1 n=1 Tax=Cetraspora pellucida TaxID=1433469 RepID=A0A9N9EI32_9GLOM|nr:15645_t:CDS:2 [Cetraspora pellucida]